MYFAELPKNIKYEFYYNEKLFDNIIKLKYNFILSTGFTITEPLSYLIYKKENGQKVLLIEKTQEEIVDEIKEYIKQNIGKYGFDKYDEVKNYQYVCQFDDNIVKDCYKKYFTEKKKPTYKAIKRNGKIENTIDIDDILRINIQDVLDKIGIEYKKIGYDTLALYEDGKWTDGWRADLTKNIVKDFSKGTRPQGNPFILVKKYYGLNDDETFSFFRQEFNLGGG